MGMYALQQTIMAYTAAKLISGVPSVQSNDSRSRFNIGQPASGLELKIHEELMCTLLSDRAPKFLIMNSDA